MKTKLLVIILIILFPCFSAYSQLSGVYTIDPSLPASPTNYVNFTTAVNDLNTIGIISSVEFIVAPGIYNEALIINQIPGATPTANVHFYSATLNPADVYLQRVSTNPATQNLLLDGTSFIQFSAIRFQTNHATKNTLIKMQNDADNVSFVSCVFSAPFHNASLTIVDYPDYALFCVDQASIGTNFNSDSLLITKSQFVGGGIGFFANAFTTPTSGMKNLEINLCEFQQNSNVCLYAKGLEDAEIGKNVFNSQRTHTGEVVGVYLVGGMSMSKPFLLYENDLFVGNQVNDVKAIHLESFIADGHNSIIKNNTALATGNSGIVGIETTNNDSIRVLHNTIRLLGGLSGAAFYEHSLSTANTSLYIENNIFVSNGNPYSFVCNTDGGSGTAAIKSSDYNDLYSSGGSYLQWDGTDYATLAALQGAVGSYNQNSVDVIPIFVSFNDHHLTDPSTKDANLNGKPNSTYVSVDIDADVRSLTTPKMGADEFTMDIALIDLPNLPLLSCDTNSNFYLDAIIQNVASQDILMGDTIIATIDLAPNPLIIDTIILGSTLTQGNSFTHTFSTPVDLSVPGTYDFTVYVSLRFDMDRTNDTIHRTVEIGPSYHVTLPPEEYCDGEVRFFAGQNITTTGTYYDSLSTVLGCDSIIELTITFNDTFRIIVNQDICQGDSLFVGGAWQNISGTYLDSLLTTNGCDSIIETNLTVHPTSYTLLPDIDICDGDSVQLFGSLWVNLPGAYFDTLNNSNGCDSIIEQNINVHPVYHDTLPLITICDNDSVFFASAWIITAGWYTDTLSSVSFCDSIIYQEIAVNPTYLIPQAIAICDNDSILINGNWVNTPGVYHDSLSSSVGCDSIIEITLTVLSTIINTTNQEICDGDSILIHGNWVLTAGVYDDTLISSYGCDSIERVILTVNPLSYTVLPVIEICENDSAFIFGSQWVSIPGLYFDTLLNVHNCDSVLEQEIIVHPIIYDTLPLITICDNDSVLFASTWINTAGWYIDTLVSAALCDSIVYQEIAVNPTSFSIKDVHICDGDSILINGSWIYVSGVYNDSLLTSLGCDSVIQINLTVSSPMLIITNVHICDGDSAFIHGNWEFLAGNYDDTLASVFGCDSINRTTLHLHPNYLNVLPSIDICENDSVLIFGSTWISTAGIYYDTLLSINGCDSVLEQSIIVNPIYQDTLPIITICDNDSVFFASSWISTAGLYTDTLSSVALCDSIIYQEIQVNPTSFETRNIFRCLGDSVLINGTWVFTTGVYYDSLLSSNGCDSIIEINLTIASPIIINANIDICDGDSLLVHGVWRYVSGVYDDTLVSSYGCDSINRVTLTVYPGSFTSLPTIDICANDSALIFGTQWINTSGTYYDTLLNANNCDSVIEQIVQVHPLFNDTLPTISICDDDSVFFASSWINTSGWYSDTLVSAYLCDSIVNQEIIVNPTFFVSTNQDICAGDSILVNGSWVFTSGVYYDSLTTVSLCDSIIEINLNVIDILVDTSYLSICDGDSALIHGNWTFVSGVYDDTLLGSYGCDSINRVILTVNPTHYVVLPPTSYCANDSVLIFGSQWVNTAATYFDTLSNIYGCDSILEITVNEYPIYRDTLVASICANDSILFAAQYYNTSGFYSDTLNSVNNCDSILSLDLTVYPVYVQNINQTICANDSILFAGNWLNTAGTYYDSLSSVNGCDSVIILNLTVDPNIFVSQHQLICQGDSVFFASQWYYNSGIYYDTVPSLITCDTIFELILDVGTPDTNYVNTNLCFNDSLFFNGQWLNSSGTYYDTLNNIYGCDSLIVLSLNYYSDTLPYAILNQTICVGDSFWFASNWLHLAGTYFDTTLTANLCDSVTELRLDIAFPSFTTITQTICANDSFFFAGQFLHSPGFYYDTLLNAVGCDSIVELILQFNPTYHHIVNQLICEGDTFLFNGVPLYSPGAYYDTLMTVDGCDSVIQVNLNFDRIYIGPDTGLCYGSCITLHANGGVSSYLWSTGSGLSTILACPTVSQNYWVTATTALGCDVSDTIYIEVYPLPVAIIDAADTAFVGDSIVFNSFSYIDPIDSIVQYVWEFPGGVLINGNPVTYAFNTPGIYDVILYVYSSNGCMDSTTHRIVIVEQPSKVPITVNLISPNSDGVNDYFVIYNIERYENYNLWIFNRWGEIVYHTTNYQNDWDAKYKGKDLNEATYYWLLEDEDGSSYSGPITVIR
jgi:gliding motility-associated-like protein